MDRHPLTAGAVHVWTIALDTDPSRVSSMLDVLSGPERVRAARLRTTELRLRFIVAHGALRRILAAYTATPAEAIRLDTNPFGKPFIPGEPVSFNLSHSEAVTVCAVAAEGRLGVDIEYMRTVADADAVANRYFAPAEARGYAALPRIERPAAFFSTWTRKEAFVKALGDGRRCPLDSFEVDITPSAVEPSIRVDAKHGQWHLRSFEPAAGYAGAVACDRAIIALERFDFDEDTSGVVVGDARRPEQPRAGRAMWPAGNRSPS